MALIDGRDSSLREVRPSPGRFPIGFETPFLQDGREARVVPGARRERMLGATVSATLTEAGGAGSPVCAGGWAEAGGALTLTVPTMPCASWGRHT